MYGIKKWRLKSHHDKMGKKERVTTDDSQQQTDHQQERERQHLFVRIERVRNRR